MADPPQGRRTRAGRKTSLPTMADVARLAEVSVPTVSRVLSGHPQVSADKRERVLDVARRHGYAVNRNAQKLRHARTNTVAVVLDFGSHRQGAIADPFVFELLAGVSEALSVRDQDLLLSPPGLDTVEGFKDFHRARGADGFVVLGQGARDAMLRQIARQGLPLVVWGAVSPEAGYCAIGSDNRAGGRLVGERFAALGRRRWLFVGDTGHEEMRLRYEGLRTVAERVGGIVVDHLPVASMAFATTFATIGAHIASGTERPDAVFAFSDTAAMAVIGAFREADWLTPRDYALVGYNNIPPAAHFTPALTTVEQQTDVAGALLVEKLMQQLDGGRPKSVMLPTRLIVRET